MSENIALNKFVGGNAKLAVENSANSFSIVTNTDCSEHYLIYEIEAYE